LDSDLTLHSAFLFSLMMHRQPISTLFPYTTLFRSEDQMKTFGMLKVPNQQSAGDREKTSGNDGRDPQPNVIVYAEHSKQDEQTRDRKSTRLNSSHLGISYAVFCLKKKNDE